MCCPLQQALDFTCTSSSRKRLMLFQVLAETMLQYHVQIAQYRVVVSFLCFLFNSASIKHVQIVSVTSYFLKSVTLKILLTAMSCTWAIYGMYYFVKKLENYHRVELVIRVYNAGTSITEKLKPTSAEASLSFWMHSVTGRVPSSAGMELFNARKLRPVIAQFDATVLSTSSSLVRAV